MWWEKKRGGQTEWCVHKLAFCRLQNSHSTKHQVSLGENHRSGCRQSFWQTCTVVRLGIKVDDLQEEAPLSMMCLPTKFTQKRLRLHAPLTTSTAHEGSSSPCIFYGMSDEYLNQTKYQSPFTNVPKSTRLKISIWRFFQRFSSFTFMARTWWITT